MICPQPRGDRCSRRFFIDRVEEELHDAGPIGVEVFLQIQDGTIAVVPDRLVAVRRIRQPFVAENFRMDTHDQYFLVIGSVEDADPPAFG